MKAFVGNYSIMTLKLILQYVRIKLYFEVKWYSKFIFTIIIDMGNYVKNITWYLH